MNRLSHLTVPAILATCFALAATSPAADSDYEGDIDFALDAIEKECGHFFELKRIDWKAVRKEFTAEAKNVETDQQHYVLLWRLLARLKDGHASVRNTEKSRNIRWQEEPKTGPGMFWCRIGNRIYVKNSWSAAEKARIEPGMEILEVNGEPVIDWLKQRIADTSDVYSFSTPHQAFYFVCHWGLADPPGTEMKLKMRTVSGGSASRSFEYSEANPVPWGPAFYPKAMERENLADVNFGFTDDKWGYIQVRRCKADLSEQIDTALATVGGAPGLILDFRGNSGGGMDHEAFMGRFIPEGKSMSFVGKYESAGTNPYGGPIVVIVDGTVRSTGETASGIFKEDGRAYMIGESPTAGMSSSKKTIALPSGLFDLYVSVYSNKKRFQNGEGIEGIGIKPHELVPFDPKDLADGVDTLIKVAGERLASFPQDKVPYIPADFGWQAPR